MCLFDIENLAVYGKREYQEKELQEVLKFYNLKLEEFMEYCNEKEEIRRMYQESIKNNHRIQMNPKTKMENQFFEENQKEISKKVSIVATNFCKDHICIQEKEDFMQDSYEYILSQGGYITENMLHNKKECMKILGHRMMANLIKKYYQRPIELRIDYQNMEIPEDYNKNYIDMRFSPERILEEKEEVLEIHSEIVRNIKANLDFALDTREEFFRVLAFEMGIEEEKMQELLEEIQMLILQNKLVKQDNGGRIIF